MNSKQYPKRLIEVDLPIKEISAHSRREKSIRHGHISTLHIWWARRPLAACRAVLCASLWPDPADENCPQEFREHAANTLITFAENVRSNKKLAELCQKGWTRWKRTSAETLNPNNPGHWGEIRYALLDFIADFANWDASTIPEFLETSRSLTQNAHEALGGIPGTKTLVVDPFAGGGAIPLESLRVGADSYASDINPISVLLNKVLLEIIPNNRTKLIDEVLKWGKWVEDKCKNELNDLYPLDTKKNYPIAYLWARTVRCEGPTCGTEIPLIKSLWIVKKSKKTIALKLIPDKKNKCIEFEIIENPKPSEVKNGTVAKGSATCPNCGYTTGKNSVKKQLKERSGGSWDARLFTVVYSSFGIHGRFYRIPNEEDKNKIQNALRLLNNKMAENEISLKFFPDERAPIGGGSGAGRGLSHTSYGMTKFIHLHTPRQLLALSSIAKFINMIPEFGGAKEIQIILALALGRTQDLNGALSTWANTLEAVCGSNRAQNRMPIVWDFVEAVPFAGAGGDFYSQVKWITRVIEHCEVSKYHSGHANISLAQKQSLPDDIADAIITDPPYYDAFAYSDLSDFFYAWLRRALPDGTLGYDDENLPKESEIVVYGAGTPGFRVKYDNNYFNNEMTKALSECRRIAKYCSIAVIVFANKTTIGWEALLQSIINGGWIITASWPIDTERQVRQRAQASAALTSSIHLVCRPRENPDGSINEKIGDWRDILQELPKRIHEWMPRLQQEGVVGADAIFACLGPALEIFSRYSQVEKASGDVVTLREYLEHVWAAVAKEALTMIFKDADSTGYEEDARLTAIWLWTISTGGNGNGKKEGESEKSTGYILEYDAARKIAQGLGAHLEKLNHLVEIKGDKARLLPVIERTRHLFGKENPLSQKKQKKRTDQIALFETLDEIEQDHNWNIEGIPETGETTLDKIHQSMLLFATGRGEALKRFLVEEGAGKDNRFWQLAQALSALYPSHTDEKRWVDGVLARKKSLGF